MGYSLKYSDLIFIDRTKKHNMSMRVVRVVFDM